ncbi:MULTISPECIES: hypothetical protein [unclassified Streptomyces]|uniref:hypothetical protein n=1 Tax=unclassified Streptomyces TaxID=2593676 RepID=UPI0037FE8ECF
MADEETPTTDRLRARAKYARRRLELSWRPCGRTAVREGPDELVSMVEVGTWARALELVERAAEVPEELDGDAALGWQAGTAAVVAALRTALDHQAGLLPPPPPPRPRRAPLPPRAPDEPLGHYYPSGIDWSQG